MELGYPTDVLADASEVELREKIIRLIRTHRPYALVSFDRDTSRMEFTSASGDTRDYSWQDSARGGDLSNTGVVLADHRGDGAGPNGAVLAWPVGATQPLRISNGRPLGVSLDGSTAVVYLVGEKDPIRLVPIGPGQPTTVDAGPVASAGWAGWHPDGRLLFGVSRPDGTYQTLARPAGGGASVPLLPAGYRLDGFRLLASDGGAIIARAPDGQFAICRLPAAQCAPLNGTHPEDRVAGWSGDSRSVLLLHNSATTIDIESLDIASGHRAPTRHVHTTEPSLGGARSLAIAPNGSMLLSYNRTHSALYVIKGLR